MSEFNLLDEKWIRVLSEDGSSEVGILELFENAHKYKSLNGELPTQNFALLRLLLAIMYAALCENFDSFKDAILLWTAIYNQSKFDSNTIRDYLEKHRERFYLFDDKFPFYQIPYKDIRLLYKSDDKPSGVGRLVGEISESDNKTSLFSTYSGEGKEYTSYAEAARWLLHLMIYDVASYGKNSKKYGYLTDKKSGYNGFSWAGQLGGAYIEGENMFDTLMKNFVIANFNDNKLWKQGKPAWEKAVSGEIANKLNIPPECPVELLTHQSRKIKLEKANDSVVGVRIYGGDWFDYNNYFKIEQMTLWEQSEIKGEKFIYPRKHDISSMFWAGVESIVAPQKSCPKIGVIDWCNYLIEEDLIPDFQIKICAVGAEYSSQKSSLKELYFDSLEFSAEILHSTDKESIIFANRIRDEVNKTINYLIPAYSKLAFDLYISSGGDKIKKSDIEEKARAEAYYLLDVPLRNWILRINSNDDMEEKSKEWRNVSRTFIKKAGDNLIKKHNLMICKERGGTNVAKAHYEFIGKIKRMGVTN
jgi:CRISPR system Cascade subunit CasA